MSGRRRLVLYSAPGCHLCDEARALLTPLAEQAGVALGEVDITADGRLHAQMLERIPVIELDGVVISELVPDPGAVRAVLLQSSAP